jgi:WD40 repeat protein
LQKFPARTNTIRQIGIGTVAASPDGKFLAASGGEDDAVMLFDLTGDENPHLLPRHSQEVYVLASAQ